MKNYIKYICAIFLLLGTSASAWSVTITLKAWDKSTSTYVNVGTFEKGEQPGFGPGSYSDTYLTTLAWAPGTQTTDTSFPTNGGNNNGSTYWNQYGFPTSNYNGNATELYAVYYYGGYYTTAPDVQFSEIVGCTQYDIVYGVSGSGGSNPTGDATACEDATVTFTPDPSTGYAYNGATVYLSDLETVHASLDANTTSFTMPDEDVYVYVSYTAQSYIVTLDNQDATSGGTDKIIVTYGASTNLTGTAITVPTKTGYEFGGYYTSSNGGGNLVINSSGVVQAEVETEDGQDYLTSEDREWLYASGITLYAKWTANTTTITLDKGSGGYSDGGALIDYDDLEATIVTAATNTTTGYHLEGYFTNDATPVKVLNADGSFAANNVTGYVTSGKWSNESAEITLYAHWALNTYTVHFNKNDNDATGSMGDQVFTYGTAQNLTSCGFSLAGKIFDGWATTAGGEKAYNNGAEVNNLTTTNEATVNLFAKWRTGSYTDAKFSCADWSLTGPSGDIVFITSAASKTVRSQEAFHVSGSGLPHSTALTFTTFPVNAKFEFKKADGSGLATDEYGKVNTDFYVFYTPDEGDTSDGLDEITTLYVSVEGEPRKGTLDTKTIIGRHLPTNFVIAAKKNGKWWAMPSNMTTGTPDPAEIAVDDYNNPSVAYTATTNIYSLYDQSEGRAVKLAMRGQSDAPLFGSSGSGTGIGKSSATIVTNPQSEDYLWLFTQTNTSITNPQDAKYIMTCENNNTKSVSLKDNPVQWGLYSGGTEELRLITASDIPFTEASVVEWGQHAAIIEVDATNPSINATSVVAHLGEATSAAITLNQTGTSVKGTGTKYNYTVNFGEGIDFAAAASNGAMLTLEWKNGETVKAMSNIIVPKIVATSTTMSSLMATDDPWNKADVHVLPGVTLTANAGDFSSKDVVVDRLEIYPGATVKVTKGAQDVGTLKVRTLVLRNGWTRVSGKNYNVARLYVSTDANLAKSANENVWYSDWYIDYDQYYPIAVPFWVATSSISYKNTNSSATAGVIIRYYDGARRAEHVQQDQADNWVAYTWGDGGTMPENLEPSKGYAMTAKRPSGKAFSIVRMPMTFSNPWTALGEHGSIKVEEVTTHKDQVIVTGYGKDTAPWYAMGWNFVANPYMSVFNDPNDEDGGISGKITTQEGGSIKYATIPDIDFKNYDQVPIAEANLKPASAFFIQADKASAQTITFSDGKIVPPSAPTRYTTTEVTIPEQEAYIRLSHEGGKDQMGLIIGEDYTESYEPNADLAKLLGEANAVKTYMRYGEMDMAYVAINQTLAKQWIPVTVKIPADGEYTYSLTRSSTVDALEGIYLIDYGNGDKITNLLEETYQFEAEAGTLSGRFAINAIFGERPVPTDIDIVGGDINGSEPIKFLYHDKVFILHNGVIYDATGKKVREINK